LQDGYTALKGAAANGHADCVRLLIDAGADKDAKINVRVGRCFVEAPFLFIFCSLSVFSFRVFHVFHCVNRTVVIQVYKDLFLSLFSVNF
jgi:hypothetical protein